MHEGSRGQAFVNILKVPKSSKDIGIHPQALTRHFKQIINHKNHKNQITIQKTLNKHTKSHICFVVFFLYRALYWAPPPSARFHPTAECLGIQCSGIYAPVDSDVVFRAGPYNLGDLCYLLELSANEGL